ncbi:DUF5615 family PIN-like protein [Neolewinella sp.]|uniref:DUF5615 family PIN-like protein n=1 Tax=Neolewinella sp. TaxID=2993543 RepID=UPI003B5185E4
MKILLGDEDFDHIAVGYLRELNYDVVTIQDLGLHGIKYSDPAVLQKAIELERILLTHNRKDFRYLHKQDSNHFGIVMCTQTTEHQRLAEKIAALLERTDDCKGQLLKVYRDSQSQP